MILIYGGYDFRRLSRVSHEPHQWAGAVIKSTTRNLSSIEEVQGLLAERQPLSWRPRSPIRNPARLWYYYNQLFEVKTLLAFSTG